MRDEIEITDPVTTPAGTFRVSFYRDEDPMSPRDADNLSVLVIDSRSVELDETRRRHGGRLVAAEGPYVGWGGTVRTVIERVNDGTMSEAGACRYLRLDLDAWAVLPVNVHDDWAPEVWTSEPTTTLGSRVDGFVFDTSERRAVMGPETPDQAAEWLRQDVETFSRYTSGGYVGYVVERLDDPLDEVDHDDEDAMDAATWRVVGSLWSIDSIEYAREECEREIRAFRPEEFVPAVRAVMV